MPLAPISSSGNIVPCVGPASACAPALNGRKDNPVWEGCGLTSIKTELKVEGELSVVSVTIGVKNSGKRLAEGFLIPIQPTTADLSLGVGGEPFEMMGLQCGSIAPGAEVQAKAQFTVPGRPQALWIGVQL